jgi:hypothetical protein
MKDEKEMDKLNQLNAKMQKMDEILKQDIFKNPLHEVQEKLLHDLNDFKTTFYRNLNELETLLVFLYFII